VDDHRRRAADRASQQLVLLIEDDELLRKSIRRWFGRPGLPELIEAENGKIGLALQRSRPARVVITDLFMPEKEGIETIVELRREFPAVKIIAISGGGRYGIAGSSLTIARKLGADRVLQKPFEVEELITCVRELLADE
jgi:DNA-binding response OmpR family regulator